MTNSSSRSMTMYQTMCSSFKYSQDNFEHLSQSKYIERTNRNFIRIMRSKRKPNFSITREPSKKTLSVVKLNIDNYEYHSNKFTRNKLSERICDLYAFEQQNAKEYVNSCKNLLKINSLLSYEKKKMKNEYKQFEKKKKLIKDEVNNANCKITEINKNVIPMYENYNLFLRQKIKSEKNIENDLYDKKCELYMCNHRLKKKIETIKNDINNMIKMRNFLICVKEHLTTLPPFFDEIASVANSDNSAEKKFKLSHSSSRKSVNFLPFSKKKSIIAFHNKRISVIDSCLTSPTNKYSKYLDKNYPIFNSVDEFIEKIKNLEKKNLSLNQINTENFYIIDSLKIELKSIQDQITKFDNLYHDDIQKREFKLMELKSRNVSLLSRISSLRLSLDDHNPISLPPSPRTGEFVLSLSKTQNISMLKFKAIVTSKQYTIENAYIYHYIADLTQKFYNKAPNYFRDDYDYISHLINVLFSPMNHQGSFLRKKCIELFSVLEKAVDALFAKHNKYMNNKLISAAINELKNREKTKRKNENAREQRKFINEIKEKKIENVIKKHKSIVLKVNNFRSLSYEFKDVKKKHKKKEKVKSLSLDDFL